MGKVNQKRLECADAIENPIERFFKQDELLEEYDALQDEIILLNPPDRGST